MYCASHTTLWAVDVLLDFQKAGCFYFSSLDTHGSAFSVVTIDSILSKFRERNDHMTTI